MSDLREKIERDFSDLSNGLALECLCDSAEKIAIDYANQQSIEFAEWKDRRFERYANGYKPNAQGKISGFEDRFYTINELLQIFKDKIC